MVFGMRIGLEPDVIWSRKTGFQPGWRPFFWDHLNRKTVSISVKTFFFWDHLNLGSKTDLFWVKSNENLVQDLLMLYPASKTAPPPNANSWLSADLHTKHCLPRKTIPTESQTMPALLCQRILLPFCRTQHYVELSLSTSAAKKKII